MRGVRASISATMFRHPKIEPEGYGFNSNASMKFRVNGFNSIRTVNLRLFR
jgi:hypothetical protein